LDKGYLWFEKVLMCTKYNNYATEDLL
ncbi:MAG: hypothetical protein RLZZ520_649, partial [Bacteroidota bacterium]|jgi:hypothetical protein